LTGSQNFKNLLSLSHKKFPKNSTFSKKSQPIQRLDKFYSAKQFPRRLPCSKRGRIFRFSVINRLAVRENVAEPKASGAVGTESA
jgi:hypothetical protein